jgi:hypothetical protein
VSSLEHLRRVKYELNAVSTLLQSQQDIIKDMISGTSVADGYAESDRSIQIVQSVAADLVEKQKVIKDLDSYIPELYQEVCRT